MKRPQASRDARGAVPRLSGGEKDRAEAEGVAYMARWTSRTQQLLRIWVALVVPWFAASLAWGEGIMRLPALGWLAWPAASAVIHLALRRWARSANATMAAFGVATLLQLITLIVDRIGRS